MLKKIVIEALTEFFLSEAGKEIMTTVINQALEYELKCEKSDAAGRTEIVTERRHALAALLGYMSGIEGALRGCQHDAAAARNKAVETRNLILEVADRMTKIKAIENDAVEIEYDES